MAEKDHQRKHYRKDFKIAELLKEDTLAMLPLPAKPFDIGRTEKLLADKYGKVIYDGNIYSASPQVAGKEIYIKLRAHQIEILK